MFNELKISKSAIYWVKYEKLIETKNTLLLLLEYFYLFTTDL